MVVEFLAAGTHVDAKINESETAMMVAVWNGHLDCVRALFDAGADTTLKNRRVSTALHIAKLSRKANIIEFLSKDPAYLLSLHSGEGDKLKVNRLLRLAINTEYCDYDATFPLLSAAVKSLLRKNDNVQHVDNYLRSAMIHATRNNRVEVVKELLGKNKTHADLQDKDGNSP